MSGLTKRMTYHPLNGRGYGHVTVLNVAVCVMQRVARVWQKGRILI